MATYLAKLHFRAKFAIFANFAKFANLVARKAIFYFKWSCRFFPTGRFLLFYTYFLFYKRLFFRKLVIYFSKRRDFCFVSSWLFFQRLVIFYLSGLQFGFMLACFSVKVSFLPDRSSSCWTQACTESASHQPHQPWWLGQWAKHFFCGRHFLTVYNVEQH